MGQSMLNMINFKESEQDRKTESKEAMEVEWIARLHYIAMGFFSKVEHLQDWIPGNIQRYHLPYR